MALRPELRNVLAMGFGFLLIMGGYGAPHL